MRFRLYRLTYKVPVFWVIVWYTFWRQIVPQPSGIVEASPEGCSQELKRCVRSGPVGQSHFRIVFKAVAASCQVLGRDL